MEITLTLQPTGAPATDARMRAAPGTTLAAVHEALGRLAGRPGAALYAGSRRLPAEAVLGGPGLQPGDVVGVGSPGPRAADRGGVLELGVVGGPDAGGSDPLPRGEVLVGRGPSADVRVRDPDVSRRHALVVVSSAGATVRDLASTNGTRLDGVRVGPDPVPLRVDQLLRVGETTLALAVPSEPPASVRAIGDGTVAVHRPPRLTTPQDDVEVEVPAEPHANERAGAPVLASLVPFATAALAGAFLHGGLFVALGIVSPALFVAGALVQRRTQGRRRARELVTYRLVLAEAEVALAAAVQEEIRQRRAADPDPAAVRRIARGPTSRIWERRPSDPDFCRIRLGTADLPAQVRRRSSGQGPGRPETAASVPVTVSLPAVGVLGVAGPLRPTAATARFVLAALATLHGPRDVAIALFAGRSVVDDWSWARWLPHLADDRGSRSARVGLAHERQCELLSELVRELEARQARWVGSSPWCGPCTVTVLDRWSELRQLPGLGRLLADGPAVGMFAVCLDASPELLPVCCGAVAEVTGEIGTRLRIRVSGQASVEDVIADGVSQRWSEGVARALAPLRDDSTDTPGAPPASCRLLDVVGLEPPEPAGVLAGWQRAGRATYAPIGAAAEGPFGVDLKKDGPHALVAGTTGAGKSELLQTLIASLAVANRPDAMTFVLIDYKGGAAFNDATHLPHTLGMVTDLDPHLTERALQSLNAELKRREHLLAAAAAKDIEDYWDTQHTHPTRAPTDPLPRLLLIIDEFATLVEELPDFVTGLIGIAMRGRSLGVHLILATQRPTGIVSPVIRANTNLRIALRVTDDTESHDVIDANDAARINKNTPGRGFLRVVGAAPVEFQTARVGGRPTAGAARPPEVTAVLWRAFGCPEPVVEDEPGDGPTDLQRLVAAVCAAAAAGGFGPPSSPWLPPLPPVLTLDDLDCGTPVGGRPGSAEGGGRPVVPLGLADHPAEQRQVRYAVDVADGGSVLVAGAPRSGRSTVLRTLAGSIAQRWPVDDIHLYALDCGSGALHLLADLPHCGAVVRRDQVARGVRVLALLLEEVRRRQDRLAREGFGSVAEQRGSAAPDDRLPWLMLFVDGWEGFVAGYETVDHGRPIDMLLGLAREGPAVGLKVVVTSDRQGLLTRLSAAFGERLLLRLSDRLDYALAGIPARCVPEHMPAGRGLLAAAATEVQVALLDRDPSGPAQAAALARIAASATDLAAADPPRHAPFRVRPLPRLVRLADLASNAPRAPSTTAAADPGDQPRPVAPPATGPATRPSSTEHTTDPGAHPRPVAPPATGPATRPSSTEHTTDPGAHPRPVATPTTGPATRPGPAEITTDHGDRPGPASAPEADGSPAAPARGSPPGRLPSPLAATGLTGGPTTLPAKDRPFSTLLGVGRDDAGPVGIDLAEAGPGFLVAGPPRCGRSTALITLACGLLARGTPIVLVAPRPEVTSLGGGSVAVLGPADGPRLSAALASGPTAVLVDDVTALVDAAVDQVLADLLRTGGGGHVVVAAGRNDELATTFRGVATEVRRSRAGLLLCPTWTDGELLGTRLPRGDPETIPGRGLLIGGGLQTPVQVAVAVAATAPVQGGL